MNEFAMMMTSGLAALIFEITGLMSAAFPSYASSRTIFQPFSTTIFLCTMAFPWPIVVFS